MRDREYLNEPLFFWQGGIKLRQSGIAVDIPRRQPLAFVSHAHSDHIARHELVICTPATAALYQLRLGRRPVRELPFNEPVEIGGTRITLLPAGHCLGSAMLLVELKEHSLLYTGDFRLGPSATAEVAEVPPAEVLIMESTYGHPRYRLPPRDTAIAMLKERVEWACEKDLLPVIFAYSLGKAQEVTAILNDLSLPVYVHKKIHEVHEVYRRFGIGLGKYEVFSPDVRPPAVVIMPPGATITLGRQPIFTIAVTGWAIDPRTRFRWGVDEAVPLSDHADFDGLLSLVEMVSPRRVYCLHGPEIFVEHLRSRGWDAHSLGRPTQYRLF
jgi:putative mRNA 3-end processing factor